VTGGDMPARIFSEFVAQAAAERAKAARAPATTGANISSLPEVSTASIRGVPNIQTTGVIELDRRTVRLFGVEGIRGRAVREFRRYLGRREVVCEPAGSGNLYRCRLGDQDLSRVVLYNGGGRATQDATPRIESGRATCPRRPRRHLGRRG
jgi:penicillin-binding protein 1A